MPSTLLRSLTVSAALCAAGSQIVAAVPAAAEVQALAARVMQDIARQAHFNGAVVMMRDGLVVYEHAVGLAQRDPDRAFTVDTPSDGGSLAKTITAALVFELAAEGRLSLDDRVTRHLSDYPFAGHTVRDLVSHRSGLPDYDFFEPDFKPGQVRDTNDLLAALARRKPPPGLAAGVLVEYANLGFDLAGLIAERVTGQKLATLYRERYFKRLGMDATFVRPARFVDWPVPRTPGYRLKGTQWVLFDAFDGEGFIGASNVHASARDWARWGDAFARGHVMAADRLEAGLREPMLDSGMAHRLNRLSWYCDAGQRRCHYTGAYNGFYAQVHWDRTRREVVAYVSNSTLPPWRCARLTRDLIDALAGRVPTPEPVQSPVHIARQDLARWAGDYGAPGLGPLRITTQGDRAFVRVGSGELASLFPAAAGVLYAPTLDLWLAFSGSPDNATLHLRSVFDKIDAVRLKAGSGKP
jgi:CubicO group peptidase (beta-lactamase class C family)